MSKKASSTSVAIDYQRAFQDAPVGQALGRNRVILDCNRAFAMIFRGSVEDLVGTTFERLYPTQAHFEQTGSRIAPVLAKDLTFSDDRVMRRLDGELFWVHVSGFTNTPDDPHRDTIWAFTDLSTGRKVNSALRGSMTPRERDIAALLIEGKTGKEVGKALGISPRTVDIYKTRLLRKYSVSSTPDLVQRLLAG
ncbi:helix-turn-helix transcriptional regulator [Variovorax sp. WS11]|uniref:LuxR C-terminal-related transcriptional regulator n=1 Tax=Variovorax sp. WS11 TaxID=1105204 RepID=UPI000D0DADEC|nr:LuxR C-terminal-related transcriptional regulator [Variovorax sp. WS11]NDZ11869.1 LuxR family transcriptional regulator [Variovorax sp. WS11]PSL79044.1 helix-turn-helix transcriptional regulator [Variovorax sp. WS11]